MVISERNEAQAAILSRFFKCGKGEYGEGDCFLGVKVPVTRAIVKEYCNSLYSRCLSVGKSLAADELLKEGNALREQLLEELKSTLESPYHEVRLAALLVMVQLFKNAREESSKSLLVELYLANTIHINNWDLVDLSCYELLGRWLLDKERSLLYSLACSNMLWERRIAIVSTMQFIRSGELDDTYSIAELLVERETESGRKMHDLLQKAVGWLLREAGKRNPQRLVEWLEPRKRVLPRTLLRYAVERLPEEQRRRIMRPD